MAHLSPVQRAAGPGPIRDTALYGFELALASPQRAGAILASVQRKMGRRLHSRDRRLLSDGLYAMIRWQRLMAAVLGDERHLALWLGWLVSQGLTVDEANAQHDGARFAALADWPTAVEQVLSAEPDEAHRIARYGGFDQAIAQQLALAFSPDEARSFIDASNARAPVVLRANARHTNAAGLVKSLAHQDISAHVHARAARAVVLDQRVNLQSLDLFKRGVFEVQDAGSQLLASLVDAQGVVVDFCAGAGGKTLAMAAKGVQLHAADVRSGALKELQTRAKRAKVSVRTHVLVDGQIPAKLQAIQADRVLVDAPCSGMGVLRRHPEHRWQLDGDRLAELVALQAQILDRASTLVKPGGRLIYGTCSVLPIENELQITGFLQRNPRFSATGETLRCAPHTDDTDGFFGAVLVRD